jgi:hypothetical protein
MAEYKFPDEENEKSPASVEGTQQEEDFEIEVEDDTPDEDKGKEPMPKELVKELEEDELEDYSDKVKTRLKQMKKVWHDERREKERALREQQEAFALAKKVLDENKKLKASLTSGEKSYIDTVKNAATLELEVAKRAYKDAYETGDADKIVEAQEKLANANYRVQRANEYQPTLQDPEIDVNIPTQQAPVARPEPKALSWQERNSWFGQDPEMTSAALGLHQKLVDSGMDPQSDAYYQRIDTTMRRRFPEYFGEEETTNGGGKPVTRTETKPATVVAPASRSTSPKKVALKQSQLSTIKKLGITPEQYVKEFLKLERQNG